MYEIDTDFLFLISGTHGHMKCQFNHQLQSQDTVLLNLYKRVFPKWTFEECLIHHNDSVNME